MFRTGLLAVLRSKCLEGKTIGDNGVKLVDPMGEMLEATWEEYATLLANCSNEQLVGALSKLLIDLKIPHDVKANVIIGRDTRPSGQRLSRAFIDGVKALDGKITDYGELSTPQLHYLVRCLNTANSKNPYGAPNEDGYYEKLSKAFKEIVSGQQRISSLTVDCANGVGAPKLFKMAQIIGKDDLQVIMINDNIREKGILNYKCGADYVKVDQRIPNGLTEEQSRGRCASLDGDADRLVYFFVDGSGKFQLLDGDKIAALAAGCLADLLRNIPGLKEQVEIGVVQTAYANGSSTKYFENCGIPVACTETGVKHLHHRAEEFSIGVYFEANGHGTVLFHPKTIEAIRNVDVAKLNGSQRQSLKTLQSFIDLINQTVGDAISDLLMVEAMLTLRQWSLQQWSEMYTDLPNRQLKVKVKNRSAFVTADADRKLVEPAGLQQVVDTCVAKVEGGRSFVRPSGTEDVVRVYAEAKTRDTCDALAFEVAGEVYDRAGGVGERPKRP